MSYDKQIDQLCPHIVVEEPLLVTADQRTIRPLRPISSAQSVRVRLNGAFEVPSMGVHLPATALCAKEAPYTITPGVNDVLLVQVDNQPVQTVTLPSLYRVGPQSLADYLSTNLSRVVFTVEGNRLRFSTDTIGVASIVMFRAGSTAATTLGLPIERQFRGQQVAPGWTLINDATTLNDRPTRLLVFDEPLRSFGDFAEVSYATVRQECRRCGGIGVENDWVYGVTGEVIQVRDEALLIQEIQKIIYTTQGSNPFHPWYGTTLLESIGKKLTAGGVIQNLIVADIYTAFGRWQSIKRQQEGTLNQFVSDEEFPFRLLSVNLQQSTQDPTVVFVNITLQSRSLKPIVLERGLQLPQPFDLLGATQQQGIIRQSLQNFVQVD